jgi:retron-type reverse transcriptase
VKRAGNLLERITERENLRLAFYRAMAGKRDRADVREFAAHLEGNLQRVADRLTRSGKASILRSASGAFFGYTQFTIHDPKERLITAPSFADRVLHHAVLNVCEPVFERYLIDDTFACRRGKGRVAALQRAVHFSAQNAVALKFDIRKYFDSISHEVLLTRLERRFKDRRLLDLFRQIVGGYHTRAGCGLPIGALTSQHFANLQQELAGEPEPESGLPPCPQLRRRSGCSARRNRPLSRAAARGRNTPRAVLC